MSMLYTSTGTGLVPRRLTLRWFAFGKFIGECCQDQHVQGEHQRKTRPRCSHYKGLLGTRMACRVIPHWVKRTGLYVPAPSSHWIGCCPWERSMQLRQPPEEAVL